MSLKEIYIGTQAYIVLIPMYSHFKGIFISNDRLYRDCRVSNIEISGL